MKMKLEYLLNKKRIGIQDFCHINNISSYEELEHYCLSKEIICIDKQLFYLSQAHVKIETEEKRTSSIATPGFKPAIVEDEAPINEKIEQRKLKNNVTKSKSKPTTKRRRSRKAPEKKSVRNNNKTSQA